MLDLLYIDNLQEIIKYLSYQDVINISICNKKLNESFKNLNNIKNYKLDLLVNYFIERLNRQTMMVFDEADFIRSNNLRYLPLKNKQFIKISTNNSVDYYVEYINNSSDMKFCSKESLEKIIKILCTNNIRFIYKYNSYHDSDSYDYTKYDNAYYERKYLITCDPFELDFIYRFII